MSGELSKEDKVYLLKLARQTIENKLDSKSRPEVAVGKLSDMVKDMTGCFVTLHKKGNLRGCIGYLEGRAPLYQAVIDNAENAAFSDPRFPELTHKELNDIDIEITVLTKPVMLEYESGDDLLKKLKPNVDGVILKKGFYQSTFLPQVWEQLPEKEDFLGHLCMKAGLPGDEWKKGDLTVYIYHAYYFEEKELTKE